MNGLVEVCNEKIIPYFTEPSLFSDVWLNLANFICLLFTSEMCQVGRYQYYSVTSNVMACPVESEEPDFSETRRTGLCSRRTLAP